MSGAVPLSYPCSSSCDHFWTGQGVGQRGDADGGVICEWTQLNCVERLTGDGLAKHERLGTLWHVLTSHAVY